MANMTDWEEIVFDDLGEMELFWMKSGSSWGNHAYRKLDDAGNIMDTKTREETTISRKAKVYVRT